MKLNATCREVTRIVIEREERRLSLSERLTVRFHMLICAACPRFERQLALMRRASARWRQYSAEE